MRILFVHNNFPAQYRRIIQYLGNNKDVQMYTATLTTNEQNYGLPRVNFAPHREHRSDTHPALVATERALLMGQAAYVSLLEAKKKGLNPDIILSHSGWGAPMFLKDLFPDAKMLTYFEWYYHAVNSDSDFLRSEPYDANGQLRVRMKNTTILQDLAAMDWGQCPTRFQLSQFPKLFQSHISAIHDGVDVDFFEPKDAVQLDLGGITLTKDDEVISYIARGMEPYRGFPQFMEMVSRLQKLRPNLQVVVVGRDRCAYGAPRSDGKTYKEWALEEFDLDNARLHFTDLKPLSFLRDLLHITKAHIYFTVPFVLSWSMLEAMASGALLIGSDTAPVREMIEHGKNVLLVPFFDVDKQVETVLKVLERPDDYTELKKAAREFAVANYATRDLLPKYWQLIQNVANGSQV